MDTKLYTAAEINQYMGYTNRAKSNDNYQQFIKRCQNAGLTIELANERRRGTTYLYRILNDDFYRDGEIWVTDWSYELWEVSNQGRIRVKFTKKLLGHRDPSGYISSCSPGNNGKTTMRHLVHRDIYFSFHPEMQKDANLYVIDHINGKRDDNRLENLRALTARQNNVVRETNNNVIQEMTATMIAKYGYEQSALLLKNFLENLEKGLDK